MVGTASWSRREIIWILKQHRDGQQFEQIYQMFVENFPKRKRIPTENGIRYVCQNYGKDPDYKHVFNLEEVAFIHGVKHAGTVTHRRLVGQKGNEEILRHFLLKFPNHEWPKYACKVKAIDYVLIAWEDDPAFHRDWDVDQVDFLIRSEAAKLPYAQIMQGFQQIWHREMSEAELHYIIWRNLFECDWAFEAFEPALDVVGPARNNRKRKRSQDTAADQPSGKKLHKPLPQLQGPHSQHLNQHVMDENPSFQDFQGKICWPSEMLPAAANAKAYLHETGQQNLPQDDQISLWNANNSNQGCHQGTFNTLQQRSAPNGFLIDRPSNEEIYEPNWQLRLPPLRPVVTPQAQSIQGLYHNHNASYTPPLSTNLPPEFSYQPGPPRQMNQSFDPPLFYEPPFTASASASAPKAVGFKTSCFGPKKTFRTRLPEKRKVNADVAPYADLEGRTKDEAYARYFDSNFRSVCPATANCLANISTRSAFYLQAGQEDVRFTESQPASSSMIVERGTCDTAELLGGVNYPLPEAYFHGPAMSSHNHDSAPTAPSQDHSFPTVNSPAQSDGNPISSPNEASWALLPHLPESPNADLSAFFISTPLRTGEREDLAIDEDVSSSLDFNLPLPGEPHADWLTSGLGVGVGMGGRLDGQLLDSLLDAAEEAAAAAVGAGEWKLPSEEVDWSVVSGLML